MIKIIIKLALIRCYHETVNIHAQSFSQSCEVSTVNILILEMRKQEQKAGK